MCCVLAHGMCDRVYMLNNKCRHWVRTAGLSPQHLKKGVQGWPIVRPQLGYVGHQSVKSNQFKIQQRRKWQIITLQCKWNQVCCVVWESVEEIMNMVSCPVGGRERGLLVSGSVMTLHQHSMLSCVCTLISSLATRLTANVQPSMFVFPSIVTLEYGVTVLLVYICCPISNSNVTDCSKYLWTVYHSRNQTVETPKHIVL